MPNSPDKDPVVSQSLAVYLLIASVLLLVTLVWSLYDEFFGLRPWKAYQRAFVQRYSAFLRKQAPVQRAKEKAIENSPDFLALKQKLEDLEKDSDRPWRQLLADSQGDVLMGRGVAQPQAGDGVELGEGADDDDVFRPVVGQRSVTIDEIREGLIDGKQRCRVACRQCPELPAVEGQSGGIVGLTQDHQFPAVQLIFQGVAVEDEALVLVQQQRHDGATGPLDGRRIVEIGGHGNDGAGRK